MWCFFSLASGHKWCAKFEARHFHYPQWNVPCRGLPFLVGCQCKSAYLLSRKIGPMPTHFRFFVGQCPRIELASIAHIHERVFTTSTGATTALKLFASNIRNGMPPIIAMCHTCSTKIPRHARQAGQVHTGQARHAQASRPDQQDKCTRRTSTTRARELGLRSYTWPFPHTFGPNALDSTLCLVASSLAEALFRWARFRSSGYGQCSQGSCPMRPARGPRRLPHDIGTMRRGQPSSA